MEETVIQLVLAFGAQNVSTAKVELTFDVNLGLKNIHMEADGEPSFCIAFSDIENTVVTLPVLG